MKRIKRLTLDILPSIPSLTFRVLRLCVPPILLHPRLFVRFLGLLLFLQGSHSNMADFDELDEMPWPSVTSDDEESKPAATISPDIFPTQPPENGIPPLKLDTQPTSNNQNRRKSSRSSRNNSEEEDQQDQPIKKSRNLCGRRQPALEAMANWKAHTLETDDKHRIEMCKSANNKIALESAKDHFQRELEEAGVVRTKKTRGADKTKRHIELLKKVMDEKGVSNASKFHQMITF